METLLNLNKLVSNKQMNQTFQLLRKTHFFIISVVMKRINSSFVSGFWRNHTNAVNEAMTRTLHKLFVISLGCVKFTFGTYFASSTAI